MKNELKKVPLILWLGLILLVVALIPDLPKVTASLIISAGLFSYLGGFWLYLYLIGD